MVRRGLLTADKIRSYEADVMVDTGAVRSVLPIHVVQKLGLALVGKTRATSANDRAEDVAIAEAVGIDINGRRTTEETLVLGSEVLIGQTVLASLDLLVDGANHCVIPNPAHPDRPMIKIKMNLQDDEAPRVATRSYEVITTWSSKDRVFVAEVPELPGCTAHGDTDANALANADEAIQLWIDTAQEFGDPIPEPKDQRLMQT